MYRECQLDEEAWRGHEPAARDESPEMALMRSEAAEKLRDALDRISPAQQRVLLLRYFGQLSFQEIATVVDCPLNTVLSHARRGLLALRQILDGCMP